jgi:hypothetical protein
MRALVMLVEDLSGCSGGLKVRVRGSNSLSVVIDLTMTVLHWTRYLRGNLMVLPWQERLMYVLKY